jgi:uncharacterized glyoxalase superfamily protein PhnB
MPSLENLKKQAKLILRWRREGRLAVAHRIRAGLPSHAGLTDQEILARPFQLADAQQLIAREQGFESWEALKRGASEMTTPSAPPPAKLLIAFPQIFTTDIVASCEFYRDKLGFEIVYAYGEPPFYANVKRDNVVLNLRLADGPVLLERYRNRGEVLVANIVVQNAKQLYLEFQAAGASIFQPLCKQPWGAEDFSVQDPHGNILLFASNNDAR